MQTRSPDYNAPQAPQRENVQHVSQHVPQERGDVYHVRPPGHDDVETRPTRCTTTESLAPPPPNHGRPGTAPPPPKKKEGKEKLTFRARREKQGQGGSQIHVVALWPPQTLALVSCQ